MAVPTTAFICKECWRKIDPYSSKPRWMKKFDYGAPCEVCKRITFVLVPYPKARLP